MIKTCDLHTHSTYSDGTFTPAELIDVAIATGLSAIALCDHNMTDGLPEFLSAAKGKNIDAVPGTEISVNYNGKELHLLALYIHEQHFEKLADMFRKTDELKDKSSRDLIASLNRAGYDIDYETIKASQSNGKFNRAHVAKELTKKGYTKSIKEAFNTSLKPEHGHYKEPERLDFFDMVNFTKSINAVPVLAHPFLQLSESELETLLPVAKEAGLIGMECLYSEYDEVTTEKAFKLADKFGLMYSGGSDFHGDNKPHIKLGIGTGNLKIPYDWCKKIKRM